jgi:hypothetical protein
VETERPTQHSSLPLRPELIRTLDWVTMGEVRKA